MTTNQAFKSILSRCSITKRDLSQASMHPEVAVNVSKEEYQALRSGDLCSFPHADFGMLVASVVNMEDIHPAKSYPTYSIRLCFSRGIE